VAAAPDRHEDAMTAVDRYPLSWPVGWTRTPASERRRADFGKSQRVMVGERLVEKRRALSVADAAQRLETEIERLGGADAILSTNLRLRLDGVPRVEQREPGDVGAAVYFTLKKQDICLACDRWDRVADNIAALAQHIDALRRIERYGVGNIAQAFRGYVALPASVHDWWSVLGVTPNATLDDVEDAFRRLAMVHHPDRGGSADVMARLSEARELARRALRVQ
jgi:DnaJ domain